MGGDEDEVGQHGGGDHVVEVPLRVLHQVGERGAVDERGEGELLFVVVDAGSWSCRKEVDEKGEEGEDVDQHADDDEHSLKVDVEESQEEEELLPGGGEGSHGGQSTLSSTPVYPPSPILSGRSRQSC